MTTRDGLTGRVALVSGAVSGAASGPGRAVATAPAGAGVPRTEPDFPR
jgi:hypothetical protein